MLSKSIRRSKRLLLPTRTRKKTKIRELGDIVKEDVVKKEKKDVK